MTLVWTNQKSSISPELKRYVQFPVWFEARSCHVDMSIGQSVPGTVLKPIAKRLLTVLTTHIIILLLSISLVHDYVKLCKYHEQIILCHISYDSLVNKIRWAWLS